MPSVFNYIVLIFEAIPALAGLYYIHKFNNLRTAIFVFLILYSVINEYAALFYILEDYGSNNHLFYNIRALIHFPLLLIVYVSLIKIKGFKIVLILITIILLCQVAFSSTPEDIKYGYLSIYNIASGFAIILATTFYLIDLLRNWDGIDLKNNLWLYVSLGYLLFYVVATPIKFTLQLGWLKTSSESLVNFFILLRNLQGAVVILMNLIFTLGFIWAKKKYN